MIRKSVQSTKDHDIDPTLINQKFMIRIQSLPRTTIFSNIVTNQRMYDTNGQSVDQNSNIVLPIKEFQIEAIGDKPLRDVVRELGGWPVSERDWEEPEWPLEHLLGQLRGDYNQGIIIEQWVGPDDKNSSVNVIQLDQMTFGLPSREYFLKESSDRERKAYLKLMVEVAILFGAEREMAEMDMTDVLDFEIRLANASTPEADRHDTGAIYNKMSLQELGNSS
ncbi:neprilysin-1 [Caerostris extrusa]|uniref:Neprilysin-1 n=1 Tax=Caerostris extrusa TaxID=172846 RepID=A0AAV4SIV0_CAEEX|nr:neprilysin-1 [Caerostris extrusa]